MLRGSGAAVEPGGGDVPGNGLDEDCDGGDAIVDADGDGAGAAVDCDDADRARVPGAPGCRRTASPRTATAAPARSRPSSRRSPPAGRSSRAGWSSALKVRARPRARGQRDLQGRKHKGCPFTRRSTTASAQGAVALTKRFKGARLRPGAVIEVRVSAAAAGAKVLRIRIAQEGAEADDAVPAAGGQEAGRLRLDAPLTGPAWLYSGHRDAAVAQLARASACHAEGRGFESLQPLLEKPCYRGAFRVCGKRSSRPITCGYHCG